jgi:hypothetical protein
MKVTCPASVPWVPHVRIEELAYGYTVRVNGDRWATVSFGGLAERIAQSVPVSELYRWFKYTEG